MNPIAILFLLLWIGGALAGCGDEDSGNNPAQADSKTYQLFPPGYFSPGFREEYAMRGTSPAGLSLEGTHLELTQPIKTFAGRQVVPLLDQNDWTDTQSGDAFTTASLSNYSTDPADLKLIGTEDIITAVVTIFSDPGRIPTTAQIGDTGTLGTDTDSAGNTVVRTWRLEADTGDLAKLSWQSTVSDNAGNIIAEGNNTYVIDPMGNRQSMNILFDFKPFNDPVSWVGTKR